MLSVRTGPAAALQQVQSELEFFESDRAGKACQVKASTGSGTRRRCGRNKLIYEHLTQGLDIGRHSQRGSKKDERTSPLLPL